MINMVQLLQFKDIFPDEEAEPIINYLRNIPRELLLKSIGFFNIRPFPNYDNFFSNPRLYDQMVDKVNNYLFSNHINSKPEVLSVQTGLKFAEAVLSNRKELLDNNNNVSRDDNEMNLFKVFLCINTELIGNQVFDNVNEEDDFEKMVNLMMVFNFPFADLPHTENEKLEFSHLFIATLYKVDKLFAFLNSKPQYSNLKDGLIGSFNVTSEKEFVKQMTYLFANLVRLKATNTYLWRVEAEEKDIRAFLNSMVSEDIAPDEDFTHIKNNPIYKVNENTYSIINDFFAVDKFYKSAKFKLKELYEKDEILKKEHGNFLGFFNLEFSEKFLMKNLLDELFSKECFIKKTKREEESDKESDGEPDYYVRHNTDIFIFENKDSLVAKGIKASADINQINAVLKTKFLVDGEKKVGIGQIVTTIEEIGSKHFRFDDYVNSKDSLTIYPILLIHDRIFQTVGINYRLNQWFKEQCRDRLGDLNKTLNIKSLTVLDIDTLILCLSYFQVKDKNFKKVLDFHLCKMNGNKKVNNAPNQEALSYRKNQNIAEQLTSISRRSIPYKNGVEKLMERFKNILKDE